MQTPSSCLKVNLLQMYKNAPIQIGKCTLGVHVSLVGKLCYRTYSFFIMHGLGIQTVFYESELKCTKIFQQPCHSCSDIYQMQYIMCMVD